MEFRIRCRTCCLERSASRKVQSTHLIRSLRWALQFRIRCRTCCLERSASRKAQSTQLPSSLVAALRWALQFRIHCRTCNPSASSHAGRGCKGRSACASGRGGMPLGNGCNPSSISRVRIPCTPCTTASASDAGRDRRIPCNPDASLCREGRNPEYSGSSISSRCR